jgi:hypothetical protein
VVKLLKWLLPLGFSALIVLPIIQSPLHMEDPQTNTISQAPSRSALKSNRYTQPEPNFVPVESNAFANLDGYTYRATYGQYAFYDLEEDASFRVLDTETGYIWASTVNDDYTLEEGSPLADEGDLGLNLFWQAKLKSPYFVTYYQGLNLRDEHAFEHHLSRLEMTRVNAVDHVGFDVEVFLFLSKISFTFSVRFDINGVSVSLPFESIAEGGDFRLSSIALYPMLGATKRLRTPGYVVVPDGVGALIRYTDDPNIGVYSKRFFGSDSGLNLLTHDQPLFANMYGLVHGHGQHAMVNIIEDGAAHGILNHFGSQVFLDFNFTYVTFAYRTTYLQYLNQAKTSSVNLLQAEPSNFDIELRYQFLQGDEATYVGIANAYADHRFALHGSNVGDLVQVPMHLDVLALETKPGLFARQKVVMTNMTQLKAILDDVQTITDEAYIQYLGWQRGGYSLTAPQYEAFDASLGTLNQFKTMYDSLPDSVRLQLAVDPYHAYIHGQGYQNRDIAQSIGQEFLTKGDYYRLSSQAGADRLDMIRSQLLNWDIEGMAIESIGDQTYSNFSQSGTSKQSMIHEAMEKINRSDSVYRPMSYAWDAQALLDIPMYSSEQARLTDTVPLIPYMIAGHRPGFGRAGNFFSNTTNELLRMIDYHLYPAFFVTEASAYQLIDTPSEHIFTSRYQDWRPEIQRQYDFIADALHAVLGHHIVARDVLALGVVKVTYDHDVSIYINYSGDLYQDGSIIVQPMNVLIEGSNNA